MLNKRQENSKWNLIQTVEYLSSRKAQEQYKKVVPFVDIPTELTCQWNGHFIKNQDWFKQIWSKEEWTALVHFDQRFSILITKLPSNLPDFPEIFEYKEWQTILGLSKELLTVIQDSESNAN